MKNYESEVRERWGDTDTYREHTEKTKNYSKKKWDAANEGLMAVFAEFAVCKDRGYTADSAETKELAAKLQTHISENYYTCTDEIFAGLGMMYVEDERFQQNIDKYGDGTAAFVSAAIDAYCKGVMRK